MSTQDFETYLPESFLNYSNQYYSAATSLMGNREQFKEPIYFLFTHSIELSFKAFLNIQGPFKNRDHNLTKLFDKCVERGFSTNMNFRNVINLVQSENEYHGYRYYIFKPTFRPDLVYLKEVAGEILSIATKHVQNNPSQSPQKIVAKLTVGKPQQK